MIGSRFLASRAPVTSLALRSFTTGARATPCCPPGSWSSAHATLPALGMVRSALTRSPPHVSGLMALGGAAATRPAAISALRAMSILQEGGSSRVQAQEPAGKRGVASVAAAEGAGEEEEAGRDREKVFETEEGPQDRAIGFWLLGVSGLVAGMVCLGGLTRLTGSGLSMVKWRPHSEIPPMTLAEWEKEFEEYKTFPEYQMKRKYENFTLEEFKFIYYMEWSHRYAGRLTGLGFAIPLIYFAARGRVSAKLGRRLGFLFALGGAQGVVGWWMVSSGLRKDKMNVEKAEEWQLNTQFASVSPYRLSAHLTSAFVIYVLLFWTGMGLIDRRRIASSSPQIAQKLTYISRIALLATASAGLTVFSGGFVAGNHAGLAYSDWPYFGGQLVPNDIWDERLGWRNFTENIPTVQFDHRLLAYITTAAAATASFSVFAMSSLLPARITFAAAGLTAAILGQVSLGVATLWGGVPIHLASAHQVGALVVLSSALVFMHSLRRAAPKFLLARAQPAVARAPSARPHN